MREVGHAFFITQTCVCMWEDKKRQGKAGKRGVTEYVCARDVRESRACITSISCNLFSSFSHTLVFLSTSPFLSFYLPLLYKLPFHVTCRCHIRSPFILNREVLSFMCLLVFILLTAGVLFMPI